MTLEIRANITTLTLEDVTRIARTLLSAGIAPYKVTAREVLLALITAGYNCKEWTGKIDLAVTFQDFNKLVNKIIERGLKLSFTEFNSYTDCVEVLDGIDKPALIICDDYDFVRRGLKRIAFISLKKLKFNAEFSIVIENYRGDHLINYTNITHTVRAECKIPVLYLLNRVEDHDIILGFVTSVVREFSELNEDVIAYSILYHLRDVRYIDKVKYYTTKRVIYFLKRYIDNCVVYERENIVELYTEGRCLIKGSFLNDCIVRVLYMDLHELFKQGIDISLIRIG